MRLYLDACMLIYLIEECKPMYALIDTALRERIDAGAQIVLTELTRLECRVGPIKQHDPELLTRFDRFLNNPKRIYVPMSRQLFDKATDLRAQHNLKTPDSLHLAAALESNCDELWTNDDRLQKAAAGRLAIVTFN